MKSFLKFAIFSISFFPFISSAEERFELKVEKIESFKFGTSSWDDPSIVVGDLNGKYLGKVLLSDMQGKVNLRVSVCNNEKDAANVTISAALYDNKDEL